MNDFCMCADMKDKNQRIHELEEKICAYKAKVRDLYQVDISDLKKTISCLKERIDELDCENEFLTSRVEELEDNNNNLESLNEFVSPSKVLLIFHDDTNQFELFCNGHEIADNVYDALKQAEKRIEELRVENEKLKRENESLNKELLEKNKRIQELETGFYNISDPDLLSEARRRGYTLRSREALFRTLIDFESQIDDLKQANEELEDDNKKLESLKQHLLNHVSNKEAEIVNLKEENEKLTRALKTDINRVYGVESSLENIVISYPKGKKISNVELYFQEENDSSVMQPASLWATVPYASGKGPVTTKEDDNGHNDSISK